VKSFTEKAIKIILKIPKGKVLTYGRVALLAGSPHSARQVGYLLHSSSQAHGLPWHRVVNSRGKISMKDPMAYQTQKHLLESEGVIFSNEDTLDLKKYLWHTN
jgi:methylated-DNA-protein-cysteine methyltransferase-like protein